MDRLAGMAVFAKVAETKSFSEAARRVGLSKSAVSKHITRLERDLKARLINRTTRRLSLTEVGLAFYEHCARMVAEAEAADVVVSRLHATPSGVLKLTVPSAFGHLQIAPGISALLTRYPDMSVQMAMNDRAVDLAEEGFDIAIRVTQDPPQNIVARKLTTIRWVACAAPEYFARHGMPRTPQDLQTHNCLFYSFLESSIDWRFRSPSGDVSARAAGNFTANNSEALREAAVRGLGIALLPTFTAAADLRAGRLTPVLEQYEVEGAIANDVYALYLPTRYISPKVRAFIDFFVEYFSQEHDRY